jgi:hypothetical protein
VGPVGHTVLLRLSSISFARNTITLLTSSNKMCIFLRICKRNGADNPNQHTEISRTSVKAIAPTDFGAPRALLAIVPKSVGAPRADLAITPKWSGGPMTCSGGGSRDWRAL